MDEVTYGRLEREWFEANETFKDLDNRYKQAEMRAKELQKQAAVLFAARTPSPKELLHEEIRARHKQLREECTAAIKEVEQRAATEIKAIDAHYSELQRQVEPEYEPRVAQYRVPVIDEDGYESDGWEDFDPEEEFHTAEYDAIRAEISSLSRLMGSLSEPRTRARRTLNAARGAKLAARAQLAGR